MKVGLVGPVRGVIPQVRPGPPGGGGDGGGGAGGVSPPKVAEELGPAGVEEVLPEVVVVVELELPLGGRGVTTTPDGRGPPVSPPVAASAAAATVAVADAPPLIHV